MLYKAIIFIILLFMPLNSIADDVGIINTTTIIDDSKGWQVPKDNKNKNRNNKIKGHFAKIFTYTILLSIFLLLSYRVIEKNKEEGNL